MRALVLCGVAAAIVATIGSMTTPASAGNIAFVARTGSGSACTQAAPCASMGVAIGVAGAGGEVICLDKGNYFGGLITFGVTISCGDGLWEAPGTFVTINTPAGADVVIEGLVSDSQALPGTIVQIIGQGSVHLRRMRIGNNTATNAFAISFQPNGPAKLFVTDSFLYNFGASGISGAINVKPASGVTAEIEVERTQMENNRFGLVADGSSGGIIRGVVRDSVISGSANNAITVSSAGLSVVLGVERSKISGNGFGLVAGGASAGMLVSGSFIIGNTTGLSSSSGGALLTYRDNKLNANTADGAFTGAVGLQ